MSRASRRRRYRQRIIIWRALRVLNGTGHTYWEKFRVAHSRMMQRMEEEIRAELMADDTVTSFDMRRGRSTLFVDVNVKLLGAIREVVITGLVKA